jgi:hypothetical protein
MSTQVGLMSFADLEGKTIPQEVSGQTLQGKDCSKIGGDPYSLSEAARNALKGRGYDTLVDVRVENTTGLLVMSNCISVSGIALDSKTLESTEGEQ